MDTLLVLRDTDIFPDTVQQENTSYEFRLAVKVVLFDKNTALALVGTQHYLLPGGGVNTGETLEDAVKREILEEVGCDIIVSNKIAITEEWRAKIKRHQETHFFLATVVGEKGLPQTTQEDEQGVKISWHTLPEAISLLEKQEQEIPFESYNACFNVRTHLAVLKEFQKKNYK